MNVLSLGKSVMRIFTVALSLYYYFVHSSWSFCFFFFSYCCFIETFKLYQTLLNIMFFYLRFV